MTIKTTQRSPLPKVQARNINSRQFEVDCPYCFRKHIHGRGGLNGSRYGPRVSHCLHGNSYDVQPPAQKSEQETIQTIPPLTPTPRGPFLLQRSIFGAVCRKTLKLSKQVITWNTRTISPLLLIGICGRF
jgi:hypothetical protein